MEKDTKIVLETTADPMPQVIDLLFKKKEITISDRILEEIKRFHSYTQRMDRENTIYQFYKRERGTNLFFTFLVIDNGRENKVFRLEYYTELGVNQKIKYSQGTAYSKKVYLVFKGE